MKNKRKIIGIITAIAIIVLIVGAGVLYVHKTNKMCYETVGGGCLPKGKCSAPNDAIVDCDKLQRNLTKTDWAPGE